MGTPAKTTMSTTPFSRALLLATFFGLAIALSPIVGVAAARCDGAEVYVPGGVPYSCVGNYSDSEDPVRSCTGYFTNSYIYRGICVGDFRHGDDACLGVSASDPHMIFCMGTS